MPAHPANVHRLLCDERQLVLAFPEGREGTDRPFKDRYRLRRFRVGNFVGAATRARAPIVPVAVPGTEEAQPIFAHVSVLRRLTRLPRFPITSVDPRHELDRPEFVRVDVQHALIRRIVAAAAIDTVVDTRLIVDPLAAPLRRAHEINAIGTANILAACSGSDSSVRKLVFKSSADFYGCWPDDPAFFSEDMARPHPPRTAIEQDIVDAEDDSRCQFIHEDDIVGALEHAVRYDIPGIFNVAADGVLVLSEAISLLGKTNVPILPSWGTSFAAGQLRRVGLRIPVEMLRELRFGRGLDNRRLKAAGYTYRYTTHEAVLRLRAQQRLRPLLRSGAEPYQYEPGG